MLFRHFCHVEQAVHGWWNNGETLKAQVFLDKIKTEALGEMEREMTVCCII